MSLSGANLMRTRGLTPHTADGRCRHACLWSTWRAGPPGRLTRTQLMPTYMLHFLH